MGKQPAVIIIARHGPRLDQADRNWSTTAERPYDSPLSYGGWMQCQTLGTRISNELQNLDNTNNTDNSTTDTSNATQRPRKRRKVVIHSSPYLRCVQTSIAIAAGLRYSNQERMRPLPLPFQRMSLSRSTLGNSGDRRQSVFTDQDASTTAIRSADTEPTKLRIDPYLGEWLSPSYFEHSTPPPASDVMVSTAKQMLKNPAEEINGSDLSGPISDESSMDGSEKENEFGSMPQERAGLRGMAAMGHSLTHRPRTISFGKDVTNGVSRSAVAEAFRRRAKTITYHPPVPNYSLAPQDTIPIGYVAHARDACVEPDFDWDSAGLGWGDGGQYEEEWSTMHRRFRFGLQGMLGYYEGIYPEPEADTENNDSSEEEELVLILVSHQAGCNALIRLLTGAPALHDVGTASLTLAVRKATLDRKFSNHNHSPIGRRGSLDLGFAEDFDMKIIASVEHLRNGSNFMGLTSPRLRQSPAFSGRKMVGAESLEGFSIGDPLGWRSTSTTTLARSSSLRNNAADTSDMSAGATGLWGAGQRRGSRADSFGSAAADSYRAPPSPKTQPSIAEEVWEPEGGFTEGRTMGRSASISANGLWGPGGGNVSDTFGEGSINQAKSLAKRRWTAVEQSP